MPTVAEWQSLKSSAISRRHSGDLHGAIEEMTKAISLARTIPEFEKQTSVNLNYLTDMYLDCNALAEAETAIREAVELSRQHPGLLGDNLWMLAEVQRLKGERREALASAEEARRLYQQQGHSHGVAQAEELIERIKADSE
jgi:ATP/maltotriose-dependent transcriptional regulator MalT